MCLAESTGSRIARDALQKVCVLYELYAAAVHWATARMKNITHSDKQNKLRSICDGIGRCQPQEILKQVKTLQLGRRKPKRWRSHLPGVKTPEGAGTCDRGDLDDLWMEHFRHMEAGEIMDLKTYVENASEARTAADVQLDIAAVPTLFEVEAVLRTVKVR